MQNLRSALFTFTAVLALVSCNTPHTNKEAIAEIKDSNKTLFTSGMWHVSNFVKDGIDKKETYAAYTFEFMPNHRVTATQGSHIYKGSWKIVSDGVTDDAPAEDLDFIIEFKKQDTISQLNGEWMIEEETPLKVDLSNVSNDYSKVDRLSFKKG